MDLKLDPVTGDIAIEGGDLVLVEGRDAIKQHLTIRLRFFLGEWFLDKNAGVPYFQRILGKVETLDVVSASIRKAIMDTPGVVRLQKFDVVLDRSTRKLSVDFIAQTTDGVVEFSQEF